MGAVLAGGKRHRTTEPAGETIGPYENQQAPSVGAGVLTGPGGTIEKEKTRPRLALTNRGRAGIMRTEGMPGSVDGQPK